MKIQSMIRQVMPSLLGMFCLAACTDAPVITPDKYEQYDRTFVRDFGAPAIGRSWSEARYKAISLSTSQPTYAKVYAEVAGERFLFADMNLEKGVTPVVVTVPAEVNELIVVSEGREYVTTPGSVLELQGEMSREMSDRLKNLNAEVNSTKRKISITGNKLRYEFLHPDYEPVYPGRNDYMSLPFSGAGHEKISHNVGIYPQSYNGESFINVYPVFWQENVYGESDYLIGVCLYTETERSHKDIKHYDLETLDPRTAITMKQSGGSGRWVDKTGKSAYVFKEIDTSFLTFEIEGMRVDLSGFDGSSTAERVGFYIKSGLKDTYREGFGRECEHISYSHTLFNSTVWDPDNYWDTPYKNVKRALGGGVGYIGGSTSYKFTHLDECNDQFSANGRSYTFIYGFSSEPKGHTERNPDFSDCMILIEGTSGNSGRPKTQHGLGDQYFPWYIAAEDLGGTYDWDFNDVVVNVYDIARNITDGVPEEHFPAPRKTYRRLIVVPRASGGTLPVYLMYHGTVGPTVDITLNPYLSEIKEPTETGDFIIGTEMHRWLGAQDHTKPLNVDGDEMPWSGRSVGFAIPYDYPEVIDPSCPPKEIGKDNALMHGFWVLVDPKDEMKLYEKVAFDPTGDLNVLETKTAYTRFDGKFGEGTYTVNAPNDKAGVAPQMIMTYYNWYWPREEVNIGTAWWWFADWVQGNRDIWHSNGSDKVDPPYTPHLVCKGPLPGWVEG